MSASEHLRPRKRGLGQADGVTLLTGFLLLRLGLPSQLVVGPLGGAGSPALLLGVGLFVLWGWFRLHRRESLPSSPVNVASAVLLAAVGLTYAVAASRPITPQELNLATLSFLALISWLGGLLVASDGIEAGARMATLIKRMALLGGIFALFGLVQFVTERAWVDLLSIPGLTANQTLYGLTTREGFSRPAGTAIHPIEFGAVVCMLLPLTVAYGLGLDSSPRRRGIWGLVAWWPAAVSAVAVALSSSRSALIGLAVGMIGLLPVLAWAQRLALLVAGTLLSFFVFLFVPGMVGSVTALFSGSATDPSVISRIEGYAVAADFISRSPLLGRGMGTFLPRYHIFDNQYLLLVVETGFLGTAALVALFVIALMCAMRMMSRASAQSPERILAGGLFASCLVGGVSLAFFDGFSFPMMPGLWFVLLGLTGCAARSISAINQNRDRLHARRLTFQGSESPDTPGRSGDVGAEATRIAHREPPIV